MTAVGNSNMVCTFIASPRKNILSVDVYQKKYGYPWYTTHIGFDNNYCMTLGLS